MTVSSRITLPFPMFPRISSRRFVKKASRSAEADGVKSQQQSKKRPSQKRVRFESASMTQVIEPSVELTDELCDEMWLSFDERIEQDLERRHLTKEFRNAKGGKDMIDLKFQMLYDSCSNLELEKVLTSTAAKDAIFEPSQQGLRGLEGKLSTTCGDRRKYHMHSMLSICAFEADVDQVNLPEHLKQSIKASETLAQVMAILDANEAASTW